MEQIRDVFLKNGYPSGTRADPVLVTGNPRPVAPTEGPPLKKSKSLPEAPSSIQQFVRSTDSEAGQSSEHERELQNFWRSLDKAEMKHLPIQNANMEADEKAKVKVPDEKAKVKVPDEKAEVKVLDLKDNLPFMNGISRIMVPKFYDVLWERAEPLSSKNVGVVITGTPGTGKSVMGWYFIYKLRVQRGLFNLVYQHERSGLQTFFPKKGIVTQAATSSDKFKGLLDSRDTVYVVDGKGVLSRSARTFVFTSPNPGTYEYLKDNNSIFYSKVWSKSEILAARQLLFKDIDEHLVLELYRKWGGVPRHVLEKAKNAQWQNIIESKAQSVQGSQWLELLTNPGRVGRADGFEVSDIVLHYRTEDYMQYEVVFASSYVSQLAYSKLRSHNWVETLRFLQSNDSASASNRGILFERFAHNVLGRKCNVRVRSLEESGQSKIESLEWPLLKHRTFQKLSFKGDLLQEGTTGCYWEPESKNNAFDAVCSNIGDNLGGVAALQMTISKNHGIQ